MSKIKLRELSIKPRGFTRKLNITLGDLSDEEKKISQLNPTEIELISKIKTKKIKDIYNIIPSLKNSIKCLFYFEFKPIFLKFYYYFFSIDNGEEWKNINFGFNRNYRLNHIKKFFKKNLYKIYEFGSGASTIAIAQLLKKQFEEKGIKGKLYTYDQSDEWLNTLKAEFPKDLLSFVNFNKCEIKYYKYKDFRLLKYDIKNYENNIDLVYVDGPTHQTYREYPKPFYQANGNIFEMIEKNVFKIAITDKRFPIYFLVKHLKNINYKCEIDFIYKSVLIKKK